MKKRIVALALSLLVLLCAVPFAAAEEANQELRIAAEDHLLNMGYGDMDTRTVLAVGDTLEVWYEDSESAEVWINGALVHRLPAGEREIYGYAIKETGQIEIAVRRGDAVLASRSFEVISSREMYRRNLKDAFAAVFSTKADPFPSLETLKYAANHGFPVGNPFIPFAFVAMVAVNFFHAVFSFTRIVR